LFYFLLEKKKTKQVSSFYLTDNSGSQLKLQSGNCYSLQGNKSCLLKKSH